MPLEEQLEALQRAVSAGKVRHAALSNETPYGLARCVEAVRQRAGGSGQGRLAKIVVVQQAYSLLNRTFAAGMAEACAEGDVRLLAYAPLAAGLLSGKYHAPSAPPQDARLERYAKTGGDEDMQRYHPEGINVGEVRALVSNTPVDRL